MLPVAKPVQLRGWGLEGTEGWPSQPGEAFNRTRRPPGLSHIVPPIGGFELERVMGFEPTTFSLGRRHSTPELHPLSKRGPLISEDLPSGSWKSYSTMRTESRGQPARPEVAPSLQAIIVHSLSALASLGSMPSSIRCRAMVWLHRLWDAKKGQEQLQSLPL